ncbi:MAG: hypothetical protein MJ252_22500 [archaeon]|nr:hypothetical protein [archaeon]
MQLAERNQININAPIDGNLQNQPNQNYQTQGEQVLNLQNQNQNYQNSSNYQYNQTQPFNESDIPEQNNQTGQGIQTVNQGIDQVVRNTLKSRGINFARMQTPEQVKVNDREKKKELLDNIQAQLTLNKRTKYEELLRKRKEDEKYLQDMNTCFPFGRGGGGAPIRNKDGKIVTTRRYLISDPKYNLSSIQVDDDYDDVWCKDRKFGMTEFKNKTPNINNQRFANADMGNNMNMNNGGNMSLGGTMPRNNSARVMNNNMNMNNSNFMNTMPMNQRQNIGNRTFNNMNGGNNYNYNQRQYSNYQRNNNMNMGGNMNMDMGNNMNNMDYQMNNQMNQMNNNMNYDYQQMPMDQQQGNDFYQQPNGNQVLNNDPELNLSYDNYGMDEENKRLNKESYRNDLLTQIKEKENRKKLEKERKAREDAEEEERIRRENEELERRLQEEKNRNLKAQKDTDNANFQAQVKTPQMDNKPYGLSVTENKLTIADQEALKKFNQQEIESRMALNNEILKLREQMEDQKNNLFSQISQLTKETQDANNQRFEALKEIEVLKDELSKQRADEELRRKYVYDVIRNDNSQLGYLGSQSHLPDQPTEKVILPLKNPKDMYYDEKIRHPNRIIPIPKLTELDENQLKHQSKFIDMETRDVMDGLELYDIKNEGLTREERFQNEQEEKELNHKGYEVQGDYGTLRSYYSFNGDELKGNSNFIDEAERNLESFGRGNINSDTQKSNDYSTPINFDNPRRTPMREIRTPNKTPISTPSGKRNNMSIEDNFKKDIQSSINNNIRDLDDGHLEVNQIYNRNLERLRFLNEIESNLNMSNNNSSGYEGNYGGSTGYSKDNFDDFINKINSTCVPNY